MGSKALAASGQVQVGIHGNKAVKIDFTEGATASSFLKVAAKQLGIKGFKPGQYSIVVNGEEATGRTKLKPGDRVSAAGSVSNG